MRITYNEPHVSVRMRERIVEHRHIEATLSDADVEYPAEPGSNATHIRVRTIEGRQFKVYFSMPGPDAIHVWTIAVRNE